MKILPNTLIISPDSLPEGIVGLPYTNPDGSPVALTPSGGDGSEFINFTVNGLAPGLSWNEGLRTISGTPTEAGSYSVIAQVWDRSGNVGVKNY